MGRDSTLLAMAEELHSELCDARTRYTDFFVQFREVDRDSSDRIVPTGRLSRVYGWRWDRDRVNADGTVGGWLDVDEVTDASISVHDAAPRHFDVLCDDEHEHLLVIGSRGSGKSELGARWLMKRIAIAPKKALSLLVAKRKKARRFVEKKMLAKLPEAWLSASLGNKGRKGYRKAADEISLTFKHGCLVDCLSAKVPDDARGDDIVGALIDETQLCPSEARGNLILSSRDSDGANIQTCETATVLAGEFEEYLEAAKQDPSYLVAELSVTDNVHLDTVFDPVTGCKLPPAVIWARKHRPKDLFEQEVGVWDEDAKRFSPVPMRISGLAYYAFRRALHVVGDGKDKQAEQVIRRLYGAAHPNVGLDITRRKYRVPRLVGVSFDEEQCAGVGGRVYSTPGGAPELLWITHEWHDAQGNARAFARDVVRSGFRGAGAVPDAIGNKSEGGLSSIAILRSEGLVIRGGNRNVYERNRRMAVNGKLFNGNEEVSLLISENCPRLLSAMQGQLVGRHGELTMESNDHLFTAALGHLVAHMWPVEALAKKFGYAA